MQQESYRTVPSNQYSKQDQHQNSFRYSNPSHFDHSNIYNNMNQENKNKSSFPKDQNKSDETFDLSDQSVFYQQSNYTNNNIQKNSRQNPSYMNNDNSFYSNENDLNNSYPQQNSTGYRPYQNITRSEITRSGLSNSNSSTNNNIKNGSKTATDNHFPYQSSNSNLSSSNDNRSTQTIKKETDSLYSKKSEATGISSISPGLQTGFANSNKVTQKNDSTKNTVAAKTDNIFNPPLSKKSQPEIKKSVKAISLKSQNNELTGFFKTIVILFFMIIGSWAIYGVSVQTNLNFWSGTFNREINIVKNVLKNQESFLFISPESSQN